MKNTWIFLVSVIAIGGAVGCASFNQQGGVSAGFSDVKPILELRCLGCHQGSVLGTPVPDFRTRDGMIPGYVVPGEPDESKLIERIYLREGDSSNMPPVAHGLSAEEMNLIGEWILQGAEWPTGETLSPVLMDGGS